jgi:hypothetical protein
MLQTINLKELGRSDLLPQAVIGKPVDYFKNQGYRFERDSDSLDEFEGAALALDDGLRFALIHHQGHPADETTIYLARNDGNGDVAKITSLVRAVLDALNLPPEALVWQRRDDPDL